MVIGHTARVSGFSQSQRSQKSHTLSLEKCGSTFVCTMVFRNFSTWGAPPTAAERPAPVVRDRYTPALDPDIETTTSKKAASQSDFLVSIGTLWGVEGKHDEPEMPSDDASQMPDDASSRASSSPRWVSNDDGDGDESTIKSLLSEDDESQGNSENQSARSEEIDNRDNMEDQSAHTDERDNQDSLTEAREVPETIEDNSILSSNFTEPRTTSGPNSWENVIDYLLSAKVWSCHDASCVPVDDARYGDAEIDVESKTSTQETTKPPSVCRSEADNDLESKSSAGMNTKPPSECKPGKVAALTKFFGHPNFWKKKSAKQGLDDFQAELKATQAGHELVDQSDSQSFSSTIKTNDSNVNPTEGREIAIDVSHPLIISPTSAVQNLPGSYGINGVSCTRMVMGDMMDNVLELKNQTINLQHHVVACGTTAIQNSGGSGAAGMQTGVSALLTREIDRVCGNPVSGFALGDRSTASSPMTGEEDLNGKVTNSKRNPEEAIVREHIKSIRSILARSMDEEDSKESRRSSGNEKTEEETQATPINEITNSLKENQGSKQVKQSQSKKDGSGSTHASKKIVISGKSKSKVSHTQVSEKGRQGCNEDESQSKASLAKVSRSRASDRSLVSRTSKRLETKRSSADLSTKSRASLTGGSRKHTKPSKSGENIARDETMAKVSDTEVNASGKSVASRFSSKRSKGNASRVEPAVEDTASAHSPEPVETTDDSDEDSVSTGTSADTYSTWSTRATTAKTMNAIKTARSKMSRRPSEQSAHTNTCEVWKEVTNTLNETMLMETASSAPSRSSRASMKSSTSKRVTPKESSEKDDVMVPEPTKKKRLRSSLGRVFSRLVPAKRRTSN
jgi:hypothetical protein